MDETSKGMANTLQPAKKKKKDQSKILMLFRMKSSFELGDDQPEPRSRIIKKVQRSGPFQNLLLLQLIIT
jgi:hypothetical protein